MTKEELIEFIRKTEVPTDKLYDIFLIVEDYHLFLMEERKKAPTPDEE
jgi:hypothetical protein